MFSTSAQERHGVFHAGLPANADTGVGIEHGFVLELFESPLSHVQVVVVQQGGMEQAVDMSGHRCVAVDEHSSLWQW